MGDVRWGTRTRGASNRRRPSHLSTRHVPSAVCRLPYSFALMNSDLSVAIISPRLS